MPPPGSQLSPSRNMAFHYIGLLSMMPWLCDMDGLPQISHLSATVATVSLWNMHSHVPKVGFPSIRHNENCDLMANLLTEVCIEVCIEPNLQPTTSDQLSGATANSQDGVNKWSVGCEI